MAEVRYLENWHDVIIFCRGWSDLDKISETPTEWHVDCGDWSKSKLDVEFQYGGRLGEFNGMSSQSPLPHCMVLRPGEFNVMIPELRVTLEGAATGRIHGMSSQSHVSHCRVLPLGQFTVRIPEPHGALQGAVTWRNQCHDRATLQGVRIPSAILKMVFRHILFYFCF